MASHPVEHPTDDGRIWHNQVRELHHALLERWNARDAAGYAALFLPDGHMVGFDGSMVDGQAAIQAHLGEVFGDHQTASYVAKVRGVDELAPGVAVLRAVVGMAPPGGSDINPAANAIQALVAVQQGGQWRAALFQNTPAAFHGQSQLRDQLTEELRGLLRES